MRSESNPPKVFISYSQTSREHLESVLDIAENLRVDGVAVVIDKWHLKEGDDIHAFMERMVSDPAISHVLVVCDGQSEKPAVANVNMSVRGD